MRVKKAAYTAVFVALAIIISALEALIPLPIPGAKLGLANIIIVFVLYNIGSGEAYAVLFLRCTLSSLLFSSITSFAFSLIGGLLSLTSAYIIKKIPRRIFSYIGICIIGAALHNIGQVIVCCLMFSSYYALYYLPVLLFCSIVCGAFTGVILNSIPHDLIKYSQNEAKNEKIH